MILNVLEDAVGEAARPDAYEVTYDPAKEDIHEASDEVMATHDALFKEQDEEEGKYSERRREMIAARTMAIPRSNLTKARAAKTSNLPRREGGRRGVHLSNKKGKER